MLRLRQKRSIERCSKRWTSVDDLLKQLPWAVKLPRHFRGTQVFTALRSAFAAWVLSGRSFYANQDRFLVKPNMHGRSIKSSWAWRAWSRSDLCSNFVRTHVISELDKQSKRERFRGNSTRVSRDLPRHRRSHARRLQ